MTRSPIELLWTAKNDHVNDIGDGDHVDDIGDGDHVDVTVMVMVRQETALVGPWCIERQ